MHQQDIKLTVGHADHVCHKCSRPVALGHSAYQEILSKIWMFCPDGQDTGQQDGLRRLLLSHRDRVSTWTRWKCGQRRSRKQKVCCTWGMEVRTRGRWPICPATASQDCPLSSGLSHSWSQFLVDFQSHSRPACLLNHPQSTITNVFIGQRPKAWLPTTLLLPCLVVCPFLPVLHL